MPKSKNGREMKKAFLTKPNASIVSSSDETIDALSFVKKPGTKASIYIAHIIGAAQTLTVVLPACFGNRDGQIGLASKVCIDGQRDFHQAPVMHFWV